MKNIFVVFTISLEDDSFFSDFIRINQEMSLDEIESSIKDIIKAFNEVEILRYGENSSSIRELKNIVGYINMTNEGDKKPEKYGEYSSFDEVPDIVLEYCSPIYKTLSLYEVTKFNSNEKVYLTL